MLFLTMTFSENMTRHGLKRHVHDMRMEMLMIRFLYENTY